MSSNAPRRDHWTTSFDVVEALRVQLAGLEGPPEDIESQRLMAAVLHAKSASFIALLDSGGFVLDVNPAALIAGGIDRAEVIGLPLWMTAWWSDPMSGPSKTVAEGVAAALAGSISRFDVD